MWTETGASIAGLCLFVTYTARVFVCLVRTGWLVSSRLAKLILASLVCLWPWLSVVLVHSFQGVSAPVYATTGSDSDSGHLVTACSPESISEEGGHT